MKEKFGSRGGVTVTPGAPAVSVPVASPLPVGKLINVELTPPTTPLPEEAPGSKVTIDEGSGTRALSSALVT
jgi:hypothetical protein